MDENKEMLELLRKIQEDSRRTARNSMIQTGLTLVGAGCCVVVMVMILRLLPQIRETLDILSALDLERMVSGVNRLMESASTAMEGVEGLDFETLNKAIQDLAKVIEPLARLFGR